MSAVAYILPIFTATVFIIGLFRRVDIFSEFIAGARDGLKTGLDICPTLIALVLGIAMLRASGAFGLFAELLSPFCEKTGFPAECLPLALIRPISGSGATAVFELILAQNGAESFPARVASVMLGASETTFYTIAVYFGVTKVKYTRHTLVSSLSGDFACFFFSYLLVCMLF